MRFKLDLNNNFVNKEKIVAVRIDNKMSYNFEPTEIMPNIKYLILNVYDVYPITRTSEHIIEIITEKGKYLKYFSKEFI